MENKQSASAANENKQLASAAMEKSYELILKEIMEECETYYIDFEGIKNHTSRKPVKTPTIHQLRELVSEGLLIMKKKRKSQSKKEEKDESEEEILLRVWNNKRNLIIIKYNDLPEKFKLKQNECGQLSEEEYKNMTDGFDFMASMAAESREILRNNKTLDDRELIEKTTVDLISIDLPDVYEETMMRFKYVAE